MNFKDWTRDTGSFFWDERNSWGGGPGEGWTLADELELWSHHAAACEASWAVNQQTGSHSQGVQPNADPQPQQQRLIDDTGPLLAYSPVRQPEDRKTRLNSSTQSRGHSSPGLSESHLLPFEKPYNTDIDTLYNPGDSLDINYGSQGSQVALPPYSDQQNQLGDLGMTSFFQSMPQIGNHYAGQGPYSSSLFDLSVCPDVPVPFAPVNTPPAIRAPFDNSAVRLCSPDLYSWLGSTPFPHWGWPGSQATNIERQPVVVDDERLSHTEVGGPSPFPYGTSVQISPTTDSVSRVSDGTTMVRRSVSSSGWTRTVAPPTGAKKNDWDTCKTDVEMLFLRLNLPLRHVRKLVGKRHNIEPP